MKKPKVALARKLAVMGTPKAKRFGDPDYAPHAR
jgi:hypothetical protein